MKTELILSQIGVIADKFNKEQIKILIEIYKMLSAFSPAEIMSVQTEKNTMDLGNKVTYERWGKREVNKDDKVESEVFEICTKNGRYKQIIPINNDLHRAFCLKFKNELPAINSELKPEALLTINREQSQTLVKIAAMAKSPKQIGREQMEFVRFELSENGFKAIATDGYKVASIPFKSCVEGTGVWYIKSENLKGLKAGEIAFYNDKILINGKSITQSQDIGINENGYPKVESIWPIGYDKKVIVFKNDLVNAIKQANVTANKVTRQINLHINGSIEIQSEDLDFSNELKLSINYLEKSYTENFDVSVNGDFLLKCLACINSDKVTIEHGKENKPMILNSEVLLMPVIRTN